MYGIAEINAYMAGFFLHVYDPCLGNPATDPSGMTCPASCLCPDVDTDLYTCYGDETVEVM